MRRPLRILVFLHSLEPGGVERVAIRLCKAWQADGADVTVLLGRTGGGGGEERPRLNFVAYPSGGLPTARFETAWMMRCLLRRVRAAPPDVIFCAGNSYTVVAGVLRLIMGKHCPPIVAKVSNSLHRPDLVAPLRAGYGLWLRLQGQFITHWVGMAASMRAEIAAGLRVPEDRITIIEDPALTEDEARWLAIERDSAARRKMGGRLFLSAGRLVAQKRFDVLLRAFARGANARDWLVILGEGPQRRRLQVLANRLGLGPRVRLLGHSADMGTWLARAHAFVLASDYEGVPAVIIEAMAAGVPIICTDSSASMAELLGHGRFGDLVARRDEEVLAQAIADADGVCADLDGARAQARRFVIERGAPAYLSLMNAAAADARRD